MYDGGSEYADLVETMTGIHQQINVSVPSNQMFIEFETRSKVATKGFRAFIHRIGINFFYFLKKFEKFQLELK